MSDGYQPSLRHTFENWRDYDASFLKKVGLTFKNEWRKARRFRNCCDNIDEPGC